MKFTANECRCNDTQPGFSGHSIILNFSGVTNRTIYEGEDTLIVPLVMLRETVVNGAYVPANELIAESWNGVPVVIYHPIEDGEFVTANDPITLTKTLIGRIFNSIVTDAKLKAEAWINVEKAENIFPGIIEWLESGRPMDVSTGYFSKYDKISGTFNGKSYQVIHNDIKPDHLALLPNETGACSWIDGCGVRANRTDDMPNMNVQQALSVIQNATNNSGWRGYNHRRGDNNDSRQIIADLISDNTTPFAPDDMYGLQSLGNTALLALRDQYLPGKDNTPMTTNTKKVLVAADLEKLGIPKEVADKMIAAQNEAPKVEAVPVVNSSMPKTPEELSTLIANSVAASMKTVLPTMLAESKRPELLAKVIAHTSYTKEQAEKMDTATLEIVANGIKVAAPVTANYGARQIPVTQTEKDNPAVKAMVPVSLSTHFREEHNKATQGKAN